VRLKIAGLLAVFAGRTDITGDDWRLAGQILNTSDKVRRSILDAARFRRSEAERTKGVTAAERAANLDDHATSRATETMAAALARHVHRGNCKGGCKRRCITQATSGKHRHLVTIDEALSHAISQSWVTVKGELITPGQVAP
jgi:hypothetical protein